MPATSIRDLIVKGDDLVVGTHGRGIWILDDITPLRQLGDLIPTSAPAFAEGFGGSAVARSASGGGKAFAERSAHLFKPQVAYRVRQNTNTDTPIPPDEAAGQNPPDGAIINYTLASAASGPVTLEILDAAGKPVRRYSSADRAENPDASTAPVPLYWYRPPHPLATTAGMHRFTWDVHYQPLVGGGGRGGLPIAAVPHDTPLAANSPWAAPGIYTVKLTVDGKSDTQPLTLKMDPRVKTTPLGLAQQFTLSKQLYDGVLDAQKALDEIRALRAQTKDRQTLAAFDQKLAALAGDAGGGGRGGGGRGAAPEGPDTLSNITGGLTQLMGLLQGADVAPTTQLVAAVGQRRAALAVLLARWNALKTEAKRMNLVSG
jgi:hypothetical protein